MKDILNKKILSAVISVFLMLSIVVAPVNAVSDVVFFSEWGYNLSEMPVVPIDDKGIELRFAESLQEETIDSNSIKLEKVVDDTILNCSGGSSANFIGSFPLMQGNNHADITDKTLYIEARIRVTDTITASDCIFWLFSGATGESMGESAMVNILGNVISGVDRVGMYDCTESGQNRYGNGTMKNYDHGEWIDIIWKINGSNRRQNIWVNGEKMAGSDSLILNTAADFGAYTDIRLYMGANASRDISYIKAYTEDAPQNLLVDCDFEGITDASELEGYNVLVQDMVDFTDLPDETIAYTGSFKDADKKVYLVKNNQAFDEESTYRLSINGVLNAGGTPIAENETLSFTAQKDGVVFPGIPQITSITTATGRELIEDGTSHFGDGGYEIVFDNEMDVSTLNSNTIRLTGYKCDGTLRISDFPREVTAGHFPLTKNGETVPGGILTIETKLKIDAEEAAGYMFRVLSDVNSSETENARFILMGNVTSGKDRIGMVEAIGGSTNWGNKRFADFGSGEWVTIKWELNTEALTQNLYINGEIISGAEDAPMFSDERPFGSNVRLSLMSSGEVEDFEMSYVRAYLDNSSNTVLVDESFEKETQISELTAFQREVSGSEYFSFVSSPYDPEEVAYTGTYANMTYSISPIKELEYGKYYVLEITDGVKSEEKQVSVLNPEKRSFRYLWDEQLYVNSCNISNKSAAQAKVKIVNTKDVGKNAVVVLAIVRNGEQVGMSAPKKATVPASGIWEDIVTYSGSVPYDKTTDDIEVFVWDSLDGMRAISPHTVLIH